MKSGERLVGLDLLRVALIALVVCHHVACAYGDVGAWYYIIPPPPEGPSRLPFTVFVAVNQSFFMSLFFLVSGYFTAPGLDRKGPAAFLKDRGIRLGIPLLVYFFVLNPHVEYLSRRFEGQAGEGYLAWMQQHGLNATGSGPLWFVLSLLVFTLVYVAWSSLRPAVAREVRTAPPPSHLQILLFVLLTSVAAFGLRLFFPIGTTIWNLQFGYFALYVSFYTLGIVAYRRRWLEQLSPGLVRPWFWAATAFIVAMPLILVAGGSDPRPNMAAEPDPFLGGWSLESYVYALWEPVLCVGISLKLLYVFSRHIQKETPLRSRASKSAYTVYILHPFIVVLGTAWLANVSIDPLLKFAILSPLAVLACFAVSDAVRRLPLVRRVV